jgi:hypothetical protein
MIKNGLIAAALAAALPLLSAARPAGRVISKSDLEDKIRGGWAGKMIGVSYGAPTEFRSQGKIDEGSIPAWKPERVENSIHQDDLYVGMTLSEAMDRLGLNATTRQYGEAFKDSRYSLWHGNAGARRLLSRGLKAPLSSDPRYNSHANDIDFQIEADFIGLACPGLPRESNRYAERVGRVMAYGDGLYGGMFLGGMYSAAFFESDPRKVVEAGLACIPGKSGYALVIRDVLDWSAENPGDWRKTWALLSSKWDKDHACPDGALRPFNIDAAMNGAYIALGLLYGEKDFGKTMEIAIRSGQDSDCNASSAAGVLGVMLGYKGIPDPWKGGIPALADAKFEYTRSSFNDICRATLERALKVIRLAGGKVGETSVLIPDQKPRAPRLEQWSMGSPSARIGFREAAWSWTGAWKDEMGGKDNAEAIGKLASDAGAEASLAFEGGAVAILGELSESGGRAEIYLDGKKALRADAYIPERTYDDVLWHAYGLGPGPHTLRIVVLDSADPRSKGRKISLREAVVYKAR